MLWLIIIAIYGLGFFGTVWVLLQLPVTPGLAFLRATVWPIFWLTGWPRGEQLPMD